MQIDLLNSVETFIEKLNEKEIAKTIRTIELLEEFGNSLGMPHSKHIDDGLLVNGEASDINRKAVV